MKSIANSNIATRFGALFALGLAGAVLAGAITPAAAHKHGGGKHGHHGQHQPKQPQNPGPIGPLPKPQPPIVGGGWHATRQPAVVRDHRTPKPAVVRDHRATPAPVVRDQRTGSTVTVTDSKAKPRGGVQCLGNMCGVTKTVKTVVGGVVNRVKRSVSNGIKTAKNSKYVGSRPISR